MLFSFPNIALPKLISEGLILNECKSLILKSLKLILTNSDLHDISSSASFKSISL